MNFLGDPSSIGDAARLVLLDQDAPGEETIQYRGAQRQVYVVVKNAPFSLRLGLDQGSGKRLDFTNFGLDLEVVYDGNDLANLKVVDYVKNKPLTFKAAHENSLFRVRIVAMNPGSGTEFEPSLSLLSEPIKVISKPEQLTKKRASNKKPSLQDQLVDTVTRIEKSQESQSALIEQLLLTKHAAHMRSCEVLGEQPNEIPAANQWDQQQQQQQQQQQFLQPQQMQMQQGFDGSITPFSTQQNLMSSTSSSTSSGTMPLTSMQPQMPQAAPFDQPPSATPTGPETATQRFARVFARFMFAYNSLPPEEKPERIRRLIRSSSTRNAERLSEMLDMFSAEGIQKQLGERGNVGDEPGTCLCPGCPHRAELERIDAFYKDFLTNDQ